MALGEVPLNSHEHGAMPEELEDFGGDMSGPGGCFRTTIDNLRQKVRGECLTVRQMSPSKRQQLLLANGI